MGQEFGTVVEEEWTTPPLFGLPGSMRRVKTFISGDNLRREEADSSQFVVVRSDLGKAWLLRPKSKTYFEMDKETLQGLATMALMLFGIGIDPETGKPSIPESLFVETGRRQTLDSWTCREVLLRRSTGRPVILWLGEGLKPGLYTGILKNLMGSSADAYGSFFAQLDGLGGYPVLVEAGFGNRRFSQRLISVETKAVSKSLFELPKGYRRLESLEP